MLFITLLSVFVAFLAPAAAEVCTSDFPHEDFNADDTLWFWSKAGDFFDSPCEEIKIRETGACQRITPGSIAASKSQQIWMPAGRWSCDFYHGQTCEGDKHNQFGDGFTLPDEWQGSLGAFQCFQRDDEPPML